MIDPRQRYFVNRAPGFQPLVYGSDG